MKFALGVLHWPPQVFWSATLPELIAAIEGHNDAQGVSDEDEPITHEEANDLLAEVKRKRRKARVNGDRR